jgi:Mg2+/Co2+ transporter CorC
VDVRIGIIHTGKELEVELVDGSERDQVIADVEKSLSNPEGVLWLTDKRGRQIAVPSARIAYVEVGAAVDERRVGFGTR